MSNKISIDTTKIDDYISRLNEIMNNASNLDNNLFYYANVNGFSNVLWTLNNEGSPADFIWRIKKNIEYLNAIRTKANDVEQFLSSIDPLNYAESVAALEQDSTFVDTAFKFISNFGLVGTTINWGYSIYKAVTGDYGDAMSCLSGGFGVASGILDIVDDLDKKNLTQSIFGLADSIKVKDWWKNIKTSFKDTFTGLFDTTKGALNCVAEWARTVCDFVSTGFDNYEEYGEISGRMVAETVSEVAVGAAVDFGFKAAATGIAVGVAAGAGAILGAPVAIPGIVVGIGAFVLKGAADWVCEKFTGKNVTEYISDTILDVFDDSDDTTEGAHMSAGGNNRCRWPVVVGGRKSRRWPKPDVQWPVVVDSRQSYQSNNMN